MEGEGLIMGMVKHPLLCHYLYFAEVKLRQNIDIMAL